MIWMNHGDCNKIKSKDYDYDILYVFNLKAKLKN